MTTIKRVTKKEMYINSLRHDIDYCTIGISKGIGFYWHGDFIPKFKARRMLVEMQEELNKILADKTYKPWIEFYKALGE